MSALAGTGAALNSIQESPPPVGRSSSSGATSSSHGSRPPPPASSATWAASASNRSSPVPHPNPSAFYDTSTLSTQQLDDIETCVYNILAQGLGGGDEGGESSRRAQQCLLTVKKVLNNLLAAPKVRGGWTGYLRPAVHAAQLARYIVVSMAV